MSKPYCQKSVGVGNFMVWDIRCPGAVQVVVLDEVIIPDKRPNKLLSQSSKILADSMSGIAVLS
jgi:hypothetical protein